MIKKLSQIWNYFKKGRNEIGLILTAFNMVLTYSIKFEIDFTILQYIVFSLIFFVVCVSLGIFLAERVEPENNRISPYAQDGLLSTIALQESFEKFYQGDIDGAVEKLNEAKELRKKWLK